MLSAFAGEPSLAIVAASCFLIGLGLGLVATPTLIAAQSSVEWNQRGVVTGASLFSRSIGSAIGVAIFGAVANAIFAASGGSGMDAETITAASSAVFLAVVIASAATVVAVVAMPPTPAQGARA